LPLVTGTWSETKSQQPAASGQKQEAQGQQQRTNTEYLIPNTQLPHG
jgi:hypothetical protein